MTFILVVASLAYAIAMVKQGRRGAGLALGAFALLMPHFLLLAAGLTAAVLTGRARA